MKENMMKKCLLFILVGLLILMLSVSSFVGYYDSDGKEVIMNNLEIGMSMGLVLVSSYDDDGVVFMLKFLGLMLGVYGFYVY